MKKNYFKLVGSILIALCMMVTVGLAAIRTEAEGSSTASVEWRADVTYEADNTAPDTPDDLSGYIFGGWYKNTGSTEAPVYSPVREPVVGEKYVSKWVPAEVLGIQAQISNNIVNEDTKTKTKNKIRFVTSIDSTAYSEIGFEIKKGDAAAEEVDTTNKVFSKLYYIDATAASETPQSVDAGSLFCQGVSRYFKTYTITSIPETAFNTDITVRAYWKTLDGTQVFGTKEIKTVNYGRSWYYVDAGENAVTNSDAPDGTYSKPYTTLISAVAVETELNPKLILKSDVTVDATVNVARTMTIAGFESAKTIENTDKTSDLIKVVKDGNLTLDTLTLDGGRYGVYVDGGTAELNNVGIMNVERGVQLNNVATVTGDTLNITSPKQGISCDGESTFDYKNLTISGNTSHAINVFDKSTAIVNGGKITNAKGNGLNVAGANAATLKGVKITYAENATGYGINAYAENDVVPNVILEDVDITGAGKDGVALYNGATGSYTGGTVRGSKGKGIYLYDSEKGTNGASITLEGVNIENSTGENLYLNNKSSATVNGTLATEGGTHALAIYGGSTVVAGADYEKIDIGTHSGIGVRIYDSGSKLDVADMDITGGTNGIEMGAGTIVNLTGNVNLSNMTKTYNSTDKDYDGDGIYLKYGGTLNATNATISMDNVGYNAVYIKSGTINAGTSTINITGGCNYGLRANGGTTTIGELNIDGAKAHSAVRAQAGTVTINCGIIRNSKQYGVNALGSAKLNMTNVTITNSKNADLIWQGTGYTLNLTNVKYDTSGKLSDDGKVLDQEATPNGTITNG